MDWSAIKTEYIAGGTSYRKLAEKYDIPFSNLKRRAIKEGWAKLRDQARAEANTKIVKNESEKQAKRAARINTVADKLLKLIEKDVDERAKNAEPSDPDDYRKIAASLKDIAHLQGIKSSLDLKEQEARIKNLEKQAEKTDDSTSDVVIRIKGAEEWAE